MEIKFALFGLALLISSIPQDVSARARRSLVITTEPTSSTVQNEADKVEDFVPVVPKIYSLRVDSNVTNRYAKTRITSKVKNLGKYSQEATFSIVTPDKAFISGFIMEIDGKQYEAYIKEKEEAKKTYDQAVASGIGAAHVAVSARDSNRFTVSVNVEPQSKATFYLTYEELLVRTSDKYELVLNIQPGQPVKDLEVAVSILETRPLKFVKVPSLRSGNEVSKNNPDVDPEADIKTINDTAAVVTFKPDIIKQKLLTTGLGGKEENGLSGQFVVQYDVARDPEGGEVLVDGGYFVHFFAPEDLVPLKKQVIFILDTSGSMSGRRITQLKEAMNSILGELNHDDTFSIAEFSTTISVWDIPSQNITFREIPDNAYFYGDEKVSLTVLPPSVAATEENVKKAKEVVQKLDAYGGTNIDAALKVALKIVGENKNPKEHNPIIVFLTDGEPTVSETNPDTITSTITKLNSAKVPIFSLSFGDGADRQFLQKLSLKNQGFARHIYEAADAYLQLENFYKEISSPLLTNVTFKYVDKVKNVTRKTFPIFFKGAELYTTGIIDEGFVPPDVEAWGIRGPIILKPKVYQATGSLERLWAYLTVKQLLEQREVAEDKEPPTRDALSLALKYSFVTDVTSLVVVKPDSTSAVDTEDASRDSGNNRFANTLKYRTVGRPLLTSDRTVGGAQSPLSGFGAPLYAAIPVSADPVPYYPIAPSHQLASAGGFGGASASFAQPDAATSFAQPEAANEPVDIRFSEEQPVFTFITSTTRPLTSTLPPKPDLPWLQNALNPNGTITIDEVSYELGVGQVLGAGQNCTNSVNNSEGRCTLIHECHVIYPQLTDLENYKKYFCEQQGLAGVCCPLPGSQP